MSSQENSSQSTFLLSYINQNMILRGSGFDKKPTKRLSLNVFQSQSYVVPVIGLLWLIVVPHFYSPSFIMCH